MEHEGIHGYKDASTAQWATIQAYDLMVEPIASNGMAAYWEADSNWGRCFTECLDFLLKDVAKKHSKTLEAMGLAVPPTAPAPAPPVPLVAAAGKNCKLLRTVHSKLQ